MKLPVPRGPVSAAAIAALGRAPHDLDPAIADGFDGAETAWLTDEDLQLTLFVLYELAYRGWDGVDDAWEWQPGLIRLRTVAEDRFEAALRSLAAPHHDAAPADLSAASMARTLVAMTEQNDGPSLSKYLRGRASLPQFREFAAHRSLYHLREADPHTFGIPRLPEGARKTTRSSRSTTGPAMCPSSAPRRNAESPSWKPGRICGRAGSDVAARSVRR
ncbi:hypothetical protein BJ973_004053 [Actinoplanes tereljensis]|uniref:Uncharacterized protein n=1 Tax=Paractinoplanes tereljensis TaxID=571912 RepID=A0A919NSY2_9ACTN|nr:hypothetical protein [Actinoplanes tereljensis]GIF23441.1 hypothetical protein Ate02nite_61710 [Actinoplanes tereljensis]